MGIGRRTNKHNQWNLCRKHVKRDASKNERKNVPHGSYAECFYLAERVYYLRRSLRWSDRQLEGGERQHLCSLTTNESGWQLSVVNEKSRRLGGTTHLHRTLVQKNAGRQQRSKAQGRVLTGYKYSESVQSVATYTACSKSSQRLLRLEEWETIIEWNTSTHARIEECPIRIFEGHWSRSLLSDIQGSSIMS